MNTQGTIQTQTKRCGPISCSNQDFSIIEDFDWLDQELGYERMDNSKISFLIYLWK